MAPPGSPGRYRFGSFELQPDQRRLLKDGGTISLRPRAFDLLVALVDRAGHLVTKDELLDCVWPNAVVEEAALHVQVSALRKVVGSDAITTVSGRGYQFTLPVTSGEGEANRASSSQHNLPYQLTSFVGREQEIAQLEELVTANRLVTLTGAGGAGKTRLALEVAANAVESFPDGAWLVELAPLSDPGLVLPTLARALSLTEQPGERLIDTITDHLATKRLLIVLDNAEHLLDACVQLVDRVLRRSSRVAVLVTSRQRLGLQGERTYRVPSLTVPGREEQLTPERMSSYEGVRLFVERARLLRPDFELTAGNAPAVASLCYQLDGIPLAIELAAPRLAAMSVQELSQHLDHRFALLTGGSRTALPRHRTLRSMIDWSYDLLTIAEQAMFSRISVFAGGWTLAAAEQVCIGEGIAESDVIDLLPLLADKSLVFTEERDGTTHYRMLETVRQYAQDRLRESGDEAHWRGRHLAFFLALAQASLEKTRGPDEKAWLALLANEHGNLRSALAWSAESSPIEGLLLATALLPFWQMRGRMAEGREWLTRLLDAVPDGSAVRERARALNRAADLAMRQGDSEAASALFQQSIPLFRQIDDARGIAHSRFGLQWLAFEREDYAEFEARAKEGLAAARAAGAQRNVVLQLGSLGVAVHARGDWPAAQALFDESLQAARDLGNPHVLGWTLNAFARAECEEGNFSLAHTHIAESIVLLRDIGNLGGVATSMEGLATIALATGSPKRTGRLLSIADALRQETGEARLGRERRLYRRDLDSAKALLGDVAFEQAFHDGRATSLDDAVRYALGDQDAVKHA